MNIIEKRDFIHSYLHYASETTIDEFYETLRKEGLLKAKLENRALKSEADIIARKTFTREEVEIRTLFTSKP
jgi:septin family protein